MEGREQKLECVDNDCFQRKKGARCRDERYIGKGQESIKTPFYESRRMRESMFACRFRVSKR